MVSKKNIKYLFLIPIFIIQSCCSIDQREEKIVDTTEQIDDVIQKEVTKKDPDKGLIRTLKESKNTIIDLSKKLSIASSKLSETETELDETKKELKQTKRGIFKKQIKAGIVGIAGLSLIQFFMKLGVSWNIKISIFDVARMIISQMIKRLKSVKKK